MRVDCAVHCFARLTDMLRMKRSAWLSGASLDLLGQEMR